MENATLTSREQVRLQVLNRLLAEREGTHIGRTTLQRILAKAGVIVPHRRRPPKRRCVPKRLTSGEPRRAATVATAWSAWSPIRWIVILPSARPQGAVANR